jgi:hypothetical protein
LAFTVFSLRFCLEELDDAEADANLAFRTLLFVLASELAFCIVSREVVTGGQRRCRRNKGDSLEVSKWAERRVSGLGRQRYVEKSREEKEMKREKRKSDESGQKLTILGKALGPLGR